MKKYSVLLEFAPHVSTIDCIYKGIHPLDARNAPVTMMCVESSTWWSLTAHALPPPVCRALLAPRTCLPVASTLPPSSSWCSPPPWERLLWATSAWSTTATPGGADGGVMEPSAVRGGSTAVRSASPSLYRHIKTNCFCPYTCYCILISIYVWHVLWMCF